MICPNCGSNMSDKKKRCDRCGMDMTTYRKIYRTSNLYYNNGLARAKVRDLSGAIIALRSSLELNKMNTNARNLLGLVYYEMGETVAALSEWVISKHFQPLNNDADEYIEKVQSNPTKLDTLNQAIKRYNTALTLAKQGSGDLAIIQLKKVVNLNPHFIRAYQLLALLLMKTNDNDKARKYLAKAAKIDVSNTTTLRYLQEIVAPAVASKDLDGNPEAELSPTGAIMPISSYREDKPNIIAFVNLVIGVIIGLAVMAFLVIPTIKKGQIADENSSYVDYGSGLAQIEEKDNTISTLKTENAELTKQVEQLNEQLDSIVAPEDTSAIYNSLFNAVDTYLAELQKSKSDQDFSAVAETLASIDETSLEEDQAVKLLTTLREATYPLAAEAQYELGHDLYSNAKYEEALVELEKAMTYDPTDVDAVYFAARAYQRLEDEENAIKYYNIVLTDFPDSSRVTDSRNHLNELQQ